MMKHMKTGQRIRSVGALLLALVLAIPGSPLVTAAEALCTHVHGADCAYVQGVDCGHTAHDEACGYAEAGACQHTHGECGYAEPSACGHTHGDCAYAEAAPCQHTHDAACGLRDAAPCGHAHDEACGYDEQTGAACAHVHGECGFAEAAPCAHSHDAACGHSEARACDHAHGECGFAEAAPCGHLHDAACGHAEAMPCGHAHDDACGYVQAIACDHVHSEACAAPAPEQDTTPVQDAVPVTAIVVTTVDDIRTVALGGTLQMVASITPDEATNPAVQWTAENGTGSATILADGLLTGTGEGTVKVVAAAMDGSGAVSAPVTIEVVAEAEPEPDPEPAGMMGIALLGAGLEGTYSITGSVYLLEVFVPTYISGANIELYAEGDQPLGSTVSDANGAFSFANLNSGTYTLKVLAGSDGGVYYLKESVSVTIVDTDESVGIKLTPGNLPGTYSISGQVAREDTIMSFVNATVELYDEENNHIESTRSEGGWGIYAFAGLGPGTYTVKVPEGSYDGQYFLGASEKVTIVDADQSVGIDLTPGGPPGTYSLSVVVRPESDTSKESVIGGVAVELYDGEGIYIAGGKTSKGGLYYGGGVITFYGLRPGGYTVRIPFGPDSDDKLYYGKMQKVYVGNENTSVSIALQGGWAPETYTIYLELNVGSGEKNSSNISVELYNAWEQLIGVAMTNQDGCSFPGLEAGYYRVKVPYTIIDGQYYWGESDYVEIVDNDESFTLSIFPGTPPISCTISGTVSVPLSSGGMPNIPVALYAEDGATQLTSTTTDASGGYAFAGLSDGSYVVTVPEGSYGGKYYLKASQNVTIVDKDLSCSFTLTPGNPSGTHSVVGSVKAPGGASPLSLVTVSLHGDDGVLVASTKTSLAGGEYAFTAVPRGSYTLRVPGGTHSGREYQAASREITVADADVICAIVMEPKTAPGTYTITGSLYNAEGGHVTGASVPVVLFGGGTFLQSTTTDSRGGYAFANLENGDYKVVVLEGAYRGVYYEQATAAVTIADGSVTCAITLTPATLVSSIDVRGAGGADTITHPGGTLQMLADVLPQNATNNAVDWWVVNGTGSATISGGGLLTARANGTVTVVATAKDGTDTMGIREVTISGQSRLATAITVAAQGGAQAIDVDDGTLQLLATLQPRDALQAVSWSVSSDAATIDQGGLLTAVYDGLVTVTANATDGSGLSDAITIAITNQRTPVEAVTVSAAGNRTAITEKDGTLQMSAAVLPARGTSQDVAWSVTDGTGSAEISAEGLLTAKQNGMVYVRAAATDGSGIRSAAYAVEISGQGTSARPVAAITIAGEGGIDTITTDGGTLQMLASVFPPDADEPSLDWVLRNGSGSALLGADGLLTAGQNGTVYVHAVATDGSGVESNRFEVTISGQAAGAPAITNAITTMPVQPGQQNTFAVTASGFPAPTFTAALEGGGALPAWIGVSADGVISVDPAMDQPAGDTRIKVTAGNDAGTDAVVFTISVKEAGAGSISGNVQTWTGDSQTPYMLLTAPVELLDENGIKIASVTSVDASGYIFGDLSAGEYWVKVPAGVYNGVHCLSESLAVELGIGSYEHEMDRTIVINVDHGKGAAPTPAQAVTVTAAGGATTIETDGGTLQMRAQVTPAEAAQAVAWTVVNGSGSASIDVDGLLTAEANGTVYVRASSLEDPGIQSPFYMVTIRSQQEAARLVTYIALSTQGGARAIDTDGGTLQMLADVLPANATDPSVTWLVTEGTGSATIDETGLLTAVANGVVYVRARANDASQTVSEPMAITLGGQSARLVSIPAPAAITGLANGTAKTAAALGLPGAVALLTNEGSVQASVAWDLDASNYDPAGLGFHSFTVAGTVTLPVGVLNPDAVPLGISIRVTVNAAAGYLVSVTGGTASPPSARQGETVTISAVAAPSGKLFEAWQTSPAVSFVGGTGSADTVAQFTMPAQDVTVVAAYRDISVIAIDRQPSSMVVVHGNIGGALSVEASAEGGAALAYQWYASSNGANTGGSAIQGATGSSFTIPTDLAVGGHHYFCEVSAQGLLPVRTNVATVTVKQGLGPPLNPTLPEAPQNLSASPGDGQVTLTWDAPANNGGSPVTLYIVSWTYQGGTGSKEVTATTCDVDGLANDVEYTFTVRAVNGVGSSAHSAAVTVTLTLGDSLRVDDRVVFEVISPIQPFRGIIINDAPTPLATLSTTLQGILEQLASGDLESVDILGETNLIGEKNAVKIAGLPIADRVIAIGYILSMLEEGVTVPQSVLDLDLELQNVINPNSGEFMDDIEVINFTEESIMKGSTESGFGFYTRSNDRIPFMRMAMEVVHAAKGEYRNQDLDQRTMIENYNFSYEKHEGKQEKGWGLFSIVSGVKSFFGR